MALASLPSGSVRACVTSPPYFGLRDYKHEGQIGQEKTPQGYIEALALVFDEVYRVLAEDGTLWLNLGDSYVRKGGVGVQSGGEFVGRTRSKEVICRSSSFGGDDVFKEKDLIGIPWLVAFTLRERGWFLRQDIIWAKPNPMPESVTDRCTRSHEYVFMFSKSKRYFYDAESIKEPAVEKNAAPRRTTSKSKYHGTTLRRHEGFNDRWRPAPTRNKRSVWTIPPQPFTGAHFAVFPGTLAQTCVLAGSRPGDMILDPFAGSGTVGLVATKAARRFIGIELNPESCGIAERRIAAGFFGAAAFGSPK